MTIAERATALEMSVSGSFLQHAEIIINLQVFSYSTFF